MSESANLFLPNGIDVYKLTQYLKERYSDVGVQGQIGSPHFMNICFTDMTGAARNMSFYVYMNVPSHENDYPQKVVPNVTVNLSLGAKDTSNVILSAIAEAFGGGWLQKNDCGGYNDNDDEWIPIAGKDTFGSSPSRQLVGVYNLIKADKKNKTLPINYEESIIIDFVLRHLDEFKAL